MAIGVVNDDEVGQMERDHGGRGRGISLAALNPGDPLVNMNLILRPSKSASSSPP
jgi:hypothetical protein